MLNYFIFSVYPLFLMKSGYSEINPSSHPEGYITDSIKADKITNKSDTLFDDVRLIIVNLPDIATITFNIELLNITGSQFPRFEIGALTVDVSYIINDMHLLKFPVGDKFERHVELIYYMRILQMHGEQVRIKYIGEYYTPRGN